MDRKNMATSSWGLAILLIVVVTAKYALGVYNGNYFRKSDKVWGNILKGSQKNVN